MAARAHKQATDAIVEATVRVAACPEGDVEDLAEDKPYSYAMVLVWRSLRSRKGVN